MEKTGLAFPVVHGNGTSRKSLLAGYRMARSAVVLAMNVMEEVAPNERDYYIQADGSFEKARREHEGRVAALRMVVNDLTFLCEAVFKQKA